MGINKDFGIFLRRAHPKASCLKRERSFSGGKGGGVELSGLGMLWNLYMYFLPPLGQVVSNFSLFEFYRLSNQVWWASSGCLDSLDTSIISNGFGWLVKTSHVSYLPQNCWVGEP